MTSITILSCYSYILPYCSFFFFFNDTATTEIYTLSLHDALPILETLVMNSPDMADVVVTEFCFSTPRITMRSEEHTSELQSHSDLVCRLLLEKKKKRPKKSTRLSIVTGGIWRRECT